MRCRWSTRKFWLEPVKLIKPFGLLPLLWKMLPPLKVNPVTRRTVEVDDPVLKTISGSPAAKAFTMMVLSTAAQLHVLCPAVPEQLTCELPCRVTLVIPDGIDKLRDVLEPLGFVQVHVPEGT